VKRLLIIDVERNAGRARLVSEDSYARHGYLARPFWKRFDFARGLGEKLGRPVELPWQNRTPPAACVPVSASARPRVERLCPLDFTLYEFTAPWAHRPASARVAG
jgi:hypothetical protein